MAQQKESWIEGGHLLADHVHMMIAIPPQYVVSQVIGYIEGKSGIHLDTCCGERHCWFMVTRRLQACGAVLGLLLLAGPGASRDSVSPAVRNWLSAFISKIDEADSARRHPADSKTAVTVVVRVEVAADGSVRRAEVERSSGSRALDQQALDAVRAVSPFTAPPAELLAGADATDLSFPLQLRR